MEFINTNVLGTAVMLDCALRYWRGLDEAGKKAFRFHHVSTDEVFGSLGDEGLFTESTPYGTAPSACQCCSPTAQTTTAATSSRKN